MVADIDPIAKGGQFQQRQVKAAAIEGDQLDAVAVLGPVRGHARPKGFDDFSRPELGTVQAGNVLQAIVRADAQYAGGDRILESDRQKIGTGVGGFARLGLGPRDGLFGTRACPPRISPGPGACHRARSPCR